MSVVTESKIKQQKVPLRVQIAQKLMIDLRFFNEKAVTKSNDREPLTQLPDSIKRLIKKNALRWRNFIFRKPRKYRANNQTKP